MKETENKYQYLTEYEIEQVKKESIEEILDRLNNKEQKYKRLFWDTQHWGPVNIIIHKNGKQVQNINFDEWDTSNGFQLNELKGMVQDYERIYQDYESKISSTLILKSEWDETEEPKKTEE